MPAMEMAQDTGTLVHWCKQDGDYVQKGEPLFLVETDKVSVEIEATGTGYLANVRAQAGDQVPVGQVIAELLDQVPSKAARAPQTLQPEGCTPPRDIQISPLARRLAAELEIDPALITPRRGRIEKVDVLDYVAKAAAPARDSIRVPMNRPTQSRSSVAATPQARRMANERGIDLERVQGSGPEGKVRMRDLEAFKSHSVSAADAIVPSPTPQTAAPSVGYAVVHVAGIRKTIADRLQASYQNAPHIALTIAVDMSEIQRLIASVNDAVRAQSGHALTQTSVIAKLVGSVLVRHPRVNAHLVGDEIRQFSGVHMGIAVALDDGLIVPVVRDIDRKGLAAIQSEISDLSTRARAGTLKPNEVKGSTFTISNLGMFEIEQFNAILNPPEVGILSVGTITETPANVAGEIVLRPVMRLTLNADHRAVDGAVAAHFLQELKRTIAGLYHLLV